MSFADGVIDLSEDVSEFGVIFLGPAEGDAAGTSVSSAGDFNGDGIDDLIIGASQDDQNGVQAGATYIVFGKEDLDSEIELGSLAAPDGFSVLGASNANNFGKSVSEIGDFDADGFDDILVGRSVGILNDNFFFQSVVVFGSGSEFSQFSVREPGDARIMPIIDNLNGFQLGDVNAGIGDINNDGFGDVIVSSAPQTISRPGTAYVVFGTASPGDVFETNSLNGANGFEITGDNTFDRAGISLSEIGDFDGDGIVDFVIGADGNEEGGSSAGAAYVIFGKETGFANLDLGNLGPSEGFKIIGDAAVDLAGSSVASAGDFNGDGFDDVLVGADGGNDQGTNAGEAYVVFGRSKIPTVLDLSDAATSGVFTVQGANEFDIFGDSAGGGRDVNADGFDDIIVGARLADDGGRSSGNAYVIYGRIGVDGVLDLSTMNASDGFIIQGAAADDRTGQSVSMAGDVNNDGFQDVLVGAPRNDQGADNTGAAYLIFGPKPDTAVDRIGSITAQRIFGGDFDDTLSGLEGNDDLGGLSGNDTLDGGLGADTMDGGSGNDRFFVDDAGDVVIEAADEGADLVSTSVDLTLPDNVEQGSTLGTGDIAITGNALANFITGNAGANHLRGVGGADRLIAGLGDDTLEGGSGNDILQGQGGADRFVITANNGQDQIIDWEATTDVLDFDAPGLRFADLRITSSGNEALITFDDPAGGTGSVRLVDIDPEVLGIGILSDPGGVGSPGGIPLTAGTSGADNLAATNGDDDVVGLAGNDILNGRAGADTMLGGFGNDRYFLDDAGDQAIELEFQGTDQMDATFSFTLSDHVERGAVLGGGAVDITGNTLGNFITGSALSNVLRGEDGRDRLIAFVGEDTLIGGLDNDVLEGGLGADLFVFEADSGIDLITDFEVGVDLIDVTTLGIAFADMTIIDGALGARVIFDLAPGSVDLVTVQGVSAADLRLASFVTIFGENQPPIVGTQGNDVLFGSIEDDELQALGGNDLLDGLGGADLMLGGPGDDRYFLDDAGDVVVEQANEGTDLVSSFVDVVLSDYVENGSALGTGDVWLTGNGLNNALTGNAGSNLLSGEDGGDNLQGLEGADTIDGGDGADVLRGGLGADTFLFETGDGPDQIIDFEIGLDTINLSATALSFGDLTIVNSGLNATITYGADAIIIFNTTAVQLNEEQFVFGA